MPRRITQVRIRHFKSFGDVKVSLEPLTILVGSNGSGKGNFVDALACVRDCLADSVDLALSRRGGLGAVRRISAGRPTHVRLELRLDLDEAGEAHYGFEIAVKPSEP